MAQAMQLISAVAQEPNSRCLPQGSMHDKVNKPSPAPWHRRQECRLLRDDLPLLRPQDLDKPEPLQPVHLLSQVCIAVCAQETPQPPELGSSVMRCSTCTVAQHEKPAA